MIYKGKTGEYLQLESVSCTSKLAIYNQIESPLTFIWFEKSNSIIIDSMVHYFKRNQIICLTEFHQVDLSKHTCDLKLLRFNRSFYCVVDHDSEVGCKGILFFGASQLPVIDIPEGDLETFTTLWRMFELELKSDDELQLEMLQSMLKRFIILCTRIYKLQNNYNAVDAGRVDLIRAYNFLVEQNFKTMHTVAEYASVLSKSPKTLSNLFSKLGNKSPLQFIHERKMLEARRLLNHSDKSISDIAYELGFEDIQSFGRFFKNQEGVSPSEFKSKSVNYQD